MRDKGIIGYKANLDAAEARETALTGRRDELLIPLATADLLNPLLMSAAMLILQAAVALLAREIARQEIWFPGMGNRQGIPTYQAVASRYPSSNAPVSSPHSLHNSSLEKETLIREIQGILAALAGQGMNQKAIAEKVGAREPLLSAIKNWPANPVRASVETLGELKRRLGGVR